MKMTSVCLLAARNCQESVCLQPDLPQNRVNESNHPVSTPNLTALSSSADRITVHIQKFCCMNRSSPPGGLAGTASKKVLETVDFVLVNCP